MTVGKEYTPTTMAKDLVKDLDPRQRNIVCDPAAGDGELLLATARLFAGKGANMRRMIQTGFVAIDSDRDALDKLMDRFRAEFGVYPVCYCMDFLLDDPPEELHQSGVAYVSNPPFLGGSKVSTVLGDEYRKTLAASYGCYHGTADYCSYFFAPDD